jgi:membrane-associated phospholipid phosphatase
MRLVLSLLLCHALGGRAGAQLSLGPDSTRRPFDGPVAPLTRHDVPRFGVMLLATAATMPLDRTLARRFAEPAIANNATYDDLAKNLTKVHERSLFFASAATYALGRLTRWPDAADIGFHSAEAIAIGTAVGSILKPTIGRARPYAVKGDEPFDFQFGKGYTDGRYRAFPSLHEIGSFAAAAVLTEEVGLRSPGAKPYVGVIAYGIAGLVGVGRMYTEQHWASDVVLGSALGAFIGRRMVHYAHSRSRSRMDRWFLGATPTSDGGSRIAVGHVF